MTVQPQPHDQHHPLRGIGLLTPLADDIDIRGLDRADAPMLAAHLLRLPPEDRHSRFNAATKDEAIAAYVGQLDWRRAFVFGAVIDGELRAVVELVPLAGGTDAEVALSVEPQMQHRGLGRVLLLTAMIAARHLGLQTIHLIYQPGNPGMRALAQELGATANREGAHVDAVIRILQRGDAPPDGVSRADEGPVSGQPPE